FGSRCGDPGPLPLVTPSRGQPGQPFQAGGGPAAVADLAPQRQALLVERSGERVLTLAGGQLTQALEGAGDCALVARFAPNRQALLLHRSRGLEISLNS